MNAPGPRPLPAHVLRPPSPRERVLAAATEALLGRRGAPPAPLVARLMVTLNASSERPRRDRP